MQFLKTLPRLSPRTGQGYAPEARLHSAGHPPATGAHPQSLNLEVFNHEACNTTRGGHHPALPVRRLCGKPGTRTGPASAKPRRSRPTQCNRSRADADCLSRLRRFQFPDQTPHLLATPGHGPAGSPAKNGAGGGKAVTCFSKKRHNRGNSNSHSGLPLPSFRDCARNDGKEVGYGEAGACLFGGVC